MALRHSYGNVNADTSILSGSGDFTVTDGGEGVFTIVFTRPFGSTPAVTLTQNYPTWSNRRQGGGNTRDNCTLVAVGKDRVKVKTGDGEGNGTNRNFCFIAIGT